MAGVPSSPSPWGSLTFIPVCVCVCEAVHCVPICVCTRISVYEHICVSTYMSAYERVRVHVGAHVCECHTCVRARVYLFMCVPRSLPSMSKFR